MAKDRFAGLARPINSMPPDVKSALNESGLLDAYRARPAYQQNDYLSWIDRPKRQETRDRRVRQMLDELSAGRGYMGMEWQPRKK